HRRSVRMNESQRQTKFAGVKVNGGKDSKSRQIRKISFHDGSTVLVACAPSSSTTKENFFESASSL
ncbi:MAG TPA: hypothetical protein VF130_00780, partial [Candidatus Binatia bacterium]